jgi:ABC-2 type transport system permease protein
VKAWLLAQKDLRVYSRDRAGLLLGFGLPILLCTVFGAAMGALGGGDSVGRIELVLADEDRTEASRALVAELERSRGLRLDILAQDEQDSARSRVAEGDAPAGLEIGAGYGAALAAGDELPLTLYRDPGKEIEQQILAGNLIPALFGAVGEEFGRRISRTVLESLDFPPVGRARAQAILDASWEDMEELVSELQGAGALQEPSVPDPAEGGVEDAGDDFDFASAVSDLLGLTVEDVVGGGDAARAEKIGRQTQAVAGMAVMMLLFGLIACGGTLLEEQHSGTLERLRLAPGAGPAILGGKFLFTWVIGLLQLLVLFLYGSVVFDVPILRAPLALVVLSAVVAAATTGFGLLFAVVCRTQKQLEGLSTLVILTMSALGGSWWPLAFLPEWYRFLGHFTLNAWAMDGYQGIFWYGQGLPGIASELCVLAGIALGTGLAAWRLWERRMRV